MKLLSYPTTSFSFLSLFLQVILLSFVALSMLPRSTIAKALGNETDRFALLKFKESISNDPVGILSSWNDSMQFCKWHGISCSKRHQRITALNLQGYNLQGTLSPYMGNHSFLRSINLRNNSLFGEIPQELGRLFRLRHLNLSLNMFEGTIPVNLSYCSELRVLEIGITRLSGTIPSKLGSLVKLEHLILEDNNLTGGIPPSLGNISSLKEFSVALNNMFGTIPDELGLLKKLSVFAIGPNNFFGTVPLCLYNISSMITFSITGNQFEGTLPPTVGLTLPNLQAFYVGENELSGTIPDSFSNASQLQALDISVNNFFGQVPTSLGSLRDLWFLNLHNNSLGSNLPNSLDFIASLTNCTKLEILALSMNNFGGILPNSVSNLSSKLTKLYLGSNQIYGTIPTTLENLVNIIALGVESNLFTGVVPTSLGKLQNLQWLSLKINKLSGKIPSSLGNLSQIFELYLSDNKLQGNIPPRIADCKNLQILDISNNSLTGVIPKEIFSLSSLSIFLDLSHNSLTGSLPIDIGKLVNINGLYLSDNNLIGELPKTIGDCESLVVLYLQRNFFQGPLPSSLASLRGIEYLNLSQNNFSGQIPKDFEKIRSLLFLDLSFNNFVGEVPNEGIFHNTSAISVVGNSKLCGGVPELKLQACPTKESEHGKAGRLKVTIIIVCVVAALLLLSTFFIFYWRCKSKLKFSVTLSTMGFFSKVSYKRLYQATNGFSPSMLIGTGSFGFVYKGFLDQEENLVAIKVLNLRQKGADKSFIAECNALRNIRHRNLVKVLTCCSSMDYNGNEFKALVFEYMPNGSLEKWLHLVVDGENNSRGLNLIQRLNIAIDVASAIYYLHNDCDQPIIHCDLKPSNILLDDEMVAHVSDFGLARLISNTIGSNKGEISTIGIKGTIGYAAPEYALGSEPSKLGDVYSYGILVLEMFTGKRPTDEMFKDDFNLHNFVKMALPERLEQIVHSSLLAFEIEENALGRDRRSYRRNGGIAIDVEEENINISTPNQVNMHLRKCLVSVLEIGVACSKESQNERMDMGDVTKELQRIINAYVSHGVHAERRRTR